MFCCQLNVTILTTFGLVFINSKTKPKNLLNCHFHWNASDLRAGNLRSLYFERWSNNSLCAFVSIYWSVFDHLIEQTISECYEFNNNNKKKLIITQPCIMSVANLSIICTQLYFCESIAKFHTKLLHQKSMNQFNFQITIHAFCIHILNSILLVVKFDFDTYFGWMIYTRFMLMNILYLFNSIAIIIYMKIMLLTVK